MMLYDWLESPIGPLRVAADAAGLREIRFADRRERWPTPEHWRLDSDALRSYTTQLREYFAGRRSVFELPLAPQATRFQRAVLDRLQAIGFGETVSYGDLARQLQKPGAARAVGAACGRNPIPIVIPCHRVVASNGRLTGFAGGLARKRWLLDHESRA